MADEWDRVDKEEATSALQQLLTLVPEHRLGPAIDLFTTIHEYIVLAPEPLALKGVSWSEPAEHTNSQGYDTQVRPLDLTGPEDPMQHYGKGPADDYAPTGEDEIEHARRA